MFLFLSVPIFSKKRKKKERKRIKKATKNQTNERKQCERRPIGNIYSFCFSHFFIFTFYFILIQRGWRTSDIFFIILKQKKLNCGLMIYNLIHEPKLCISLSLSLFFLKLFTKLILYLLKKEKKPLLLLTFTYSICNA